MLLLRVLRVLVLVGLIGLSWTACVGRAPEKRASVRRLGGGGGVGEPPAHAVGTTESGRAQKSKNQTAPSGSETVRSTGIEKKESDHLAKAPGKKDSSGAVDRQVYETATPGLVLPVITKRVAPFRSDDWGEGLEVGYVIVEAVLRADGVIDDVRILRSTYEDRGFVHARIVAALKQWEFRPGRLGGQSVDVRMFLRVSLCG